MRTDHEASRFGRRNFGLVEWCDDVHHAGTESHHEAGDQEHCNMNGTGLESACDYTNRGCNLDGSFSSNLVGEKGNEPAAEQATTSKETIGGCKRQFGCFATPRERREVFFVWFRKTYLQ